MVYYKTSVYKGIHYFAFFKCRLCVLIGTVSVSDGLKHGMWVLVSMVSEPEFYGDLVYTFKKMSGMTDFSDQFRKIIMRYKCIGYNLTKPILCVSLKTILQPQDSLHA